MDNQHLDPLRDARRKFEGIARRYIPRKIEEKRRSSDHKSKLREHLLQLKQQKKLGPKFIYCRSPRKSISSSKMNSSDIPLKKQHSYDIMYGNKYRLLLWIEKDKEEKEKKYEQKFLHYELTMAFDCRLRSGILLNLHFNSKKIPKTPVGFASMSSFGMFFAVCMTGLGIPNSCKEAMLTDAFNFREVALSYAQGNSNVTLHVEIQITTLQKVGEDILETIFRADADVIIREMNIGEIINKEAHLKNLTLEPCTLNIPDLNDNGEAECCSICLRELYRNGTSCISLPCSHLFHDRCILSWISLRNSCPICRHLYRRNIYLITDKENAGVKASEALSPSK